VENLHASVDGGQDNLKTKNGIFISSVKGNLLRGCVNCSGVARSVCKSYCKSCCQYPSINYIGSVCQIISH
jgi:hypothetical protein